VAFKRPHYVNKDLSSNFQIWVRCIWLSHGFSKSCCTSSGLWERQKPFGWTIVPFGKTTGTRPHMSTIHQVDFIRSRPQWSCPRRSSHARRAARGGLVAMARPKHFASWVRFRPGWPADRPTGSMSRKREVPRLLSVGVSDGEKMNRYSPLTSGRLVDFMKVSPHGRWEQVWRCCEIISLEVLWNYAGW